MPNDVGAVECLAVPSAPLAARAGLVNPFVFQIVEKQLVGAELPSRGAGPFRVSASLLTCHPEGAAVEIAKTPPRIRNGDHNVRCAIRNHRARRETRRRRAVPSFPRTAFAESTDRPILVSRRPMFWPPWFSKSGW